MTAPTPQPPILDYQRAQKAKRHATGGLLLMGLGLVILGIVSPIKIIAELGTAALRPADIAVPLILVPWGAAYITTSLLIRKGSRTAAWIALVMTSIQAAAWICLLAFVFIKLLKGETGPSGLAGLACPLLVILIIAAAFIAVPIEVWQALRVPKIWSNHA